LAKENLQISNIISIKETKTNFTHVEPRAAHRSRNRYAVFLHHSSTAYFYWLCWLLLFVCLCQQPLVHTMLQKKLPKVPSGQVQPGKPHPRHSTEAGTAAQGKEQAREQDLSNQLHA
jgi:hypothetical protein